MVLGRRALLSRDGEADDPIFQASRAYLEGGPQKGPVPAQPPQPPVAPDGHEPGLVTGLRPWHRREYPEPGPLLTIDHGWREVAQSPLDFVQRAA